ncbi:MAG TPA: hypothetical protein VIJ87_21885, partial [Pyrinomonadaceae bacterium]
DPPYRTSCKTEKDAVRPCCRSWRKFLRQHDFRPDQFLSEQENTTMIAMKKHEQRARIRSL